jgi:hypothetical protein
MRDKLFDVLIGFVALTVTSIAAMSTASAQTTSVPIAISCTGSGQLCTPVFTTSVTTGGVLQVSYTASTGHCSDVAAHFLVDGVEVAVTPFLTPGQTSATFTLGPVAPGAHTLGVQGEGTVGGCNAGTIGGWGGSLQMTVSAFAAAAIPAPGLFVTAIALLLAAFAVFRRHAG